MWTTSKVWHMLTKKKTQLANNKAYALQPWNTANHLCDGFKTQIIASIWTWHHRHVNHLIIPFCLLVFTQMTTRCTHFSSAWTKKYRSIVKTLGIALVMWSGVILFILIPSRAAQLRLSAWTNGPHTVL